MTPHLIQAQIDGQWQDVGQRDSFEDAAAFADAMHQRTGIPYRACTPPLPTLTPAQLAEGDATEERR